MYSSEQYEFDHILPLPINKRKQIFIKPYISYNENNVHYSDKASPRIEPTVTHRNILPF